MPTFEKLVSPHDITIRDNSARIAVWDIILILFISYLSKASKAADVIF